jgi:mannose-6-phosphate isomerase-like protein (cupin superfamily)
VILSYSLAFVTQLSAKCNYFRLFSRKKKMNTKNPEFKIVPPGEGKSFWVAGDLLTCKTVSEDTRGIFSMFEVKVFPQGGPPPHLHYEQDEALYILEGELLMEVGERTFTATTGASVYIPRGQMHTFKNISNLPAKMLAISTPGGQEYFFEEIGQPATDTTHPLPCTLPEPQQLMIILQKYQMEVQLPPA